MKKTLLVAVNARFSHTNLAVRSLKLALDAAGIPAAFVEYTINQPVREILADIVSRAPGRLLFSCYIHIFLSILYDSAILKNWHIFCCLKGQI